MRWNFGALQPHWHDYELEPRRMVAVLEILTADPRIQKVFVEPHLLERFGLSDPKIRFQGCRAARHDDHIHLQVY